MQGSAGLPQEHQAAYWRKGLLQLWQKWVPEAVPAGLDHQGVLRTVHNSHCYTEPAKCHAEERKKGEWFMNGQGCFWAKCPEYETQPESQGYFKSHCNKSHFVANSDLNEAWTFVPLFLKARVFFVQLSKICCVLGCSCGEFLFLPRLVKRMQVLRTYLIQAVTPVFEPGRNVTCLLKHIWCQYCCTPVVLLCRKSSRLGFKNPCGPKGVLQGSNKDILKFKTRHKSQLAWRSHQFYPVQRSPQRQRNHRNSQACNKGHHFLTSVKQ